MGDDSSIGLVVGGCSRSTVGRSRSVIDGGRRQYRFGWSKRGR